GSQRPFRVPAMPTTSNQLERAGLIELGPDGSGHQHEPEDDPAAQARLLEQERMRAVGELAFGVAHDLNTVLGALSLALSVVARDPGCRELQGHNLDAILSIVGEGTRLVSRLQSLGRCSDLTITAMDLREAVRSAIEIAGSAMDLYGRAAGIE